MDTWNPYPKPFTAFIRNGTFAVVIGICNLNHNAGTGKYHLADIDNLMEQQRLEHITMLRVLDGLKAHTETVQPPLQETEP